MRHALLPSLFVALSLTSLPERSEAQSPPEPILAEAPVAASETPAPAPGTSSKISYSSCNVDGQVVAMTFDDGPHAQNTPRLLDILKQRGIKVTFFVVGQNAVEYPDILRRIAAEGHELANHSYSHPLLASLGESALRDQLDKTHQAVLSATGVSMKVMRPPYGALSEPQRRWTNSHFGYRVILWDVDPLDWKFRDAGRVEAEILARTKPGSIILSHDIHKTTVDAMPSTLDALTAKGFKFVTVSEILAMDRPAAPKPAATTPKAPTQSEVRPAAKTESKPEPKAANKGSDSKSSDASTKRTSNISGGGSEKKAAPQTEEELRKKWIQSVNQR